MPGERESERFWWRAAGGVLVAIYLSLYPAQFALDWLRARDLLRLSLLAVALLVVVAVATWMVRRHAAWREWLVLVLAGLLYGAYAARMSIVQERFHLVDYGLLAVLLRQALIARESRHLDANPWRRHWLPELGAIGLATACGWVDELIQAVLPNRRYDIRDVGTNALAATFAVTTFAALAAARRRGDRREVGR